MFRVVFLKGVIQQKIALTAATCPAEGESLKSRSV